MKIESIATGGWRATAPWLAACLFIVGGCRDAAKPLGPGLDEFGLPDLPAKKQANSSFERRSVPDPVLRPGGSPDDLYTKVYPVPPSFLSVLNPETSEEIEGPGNPFGTDGKGVTLRKTAREVLESVGVKFGPGAGVISGGQTGQLIVRQTREQLVLIDAIMESIHRTGEYGTSQLIEIFEIPKAEADRLQRLASPEADHREQRDAARALVSGGQGNRVSALTIPAWRGTRATLSEGYEFTYVPASAPDIDRTEIEFESRTVGTIIEIDTALESDATKVRVKLRLEHHSAPPGENKIEVTLPGQNRPVIVTAPVFHAKSIDTEIVVPAGGAKLIAVWKPGGRSEKSTYDTMLVAFLTAHLQRISPPDLKL